MEAPKHIRRDHTKLNVGRVERDELGTIRIRVINDNETVLLKDGDEFVTFLTKVELKNGTN